MYENIYNVLQNVHDMFSFCSGMQILRFIRTAYI